VIRLFFRWARGFLVMKRGPSLLFVGCCVLTVLAACRSVENTEIPALEYSAYGKKWKYFSVEHYIRDWGFDSAHRMFGLKESNKQDVYLVNDSGQKLDVGKHIVALQRDGSYRAVNCCDSLRTRAKVHNFDGKLVLMMEQKAAETTDCIVYPPGRPDDASRPIGERINYAVLFGEFDQEAQLFRIREFFPGGISDEAYKKALDDNPSQAQIDRFFYENRTPFMCK